MLPSLKWERFQLKGFHGMYKMRDAAKLANTSKSKVSRILEAGLDIVCKEPGF
ncbi:hypothetical protein [Metabacillus hrfriensis]|uniref:Uncharacterized protein n=1 Tax=Metabacillus hrfriensis TaxID=3048891 RepID=A0ACD4R6R9_9BACI|nr:hypothetical protein [Metabacillus sp. CT-WN-B3]WHZ56048.1 hypothetical protein QLQ22_15170 [Metabacillus sp. CT-WN-B3]